MISLLLLLLLPLSQVALGAKLVPASPASTKDYEPFGGKDSSILQSPADWNRNTFPIPVHSHNDYERVVPVLEALSYGVRSMESDVWLNPDDNRLYVGHDPFSLSRQRTFQSLTVKPLLQALEQANSANSILRSESEEANFFSNLQRSVSTNTSNPWNGYYSLGVGSGAPIQLLIDVKTDGETTWPYVVKELEPLRKRGWLTRYENGRIIPGPILVIGTGNTPIDQVAPLQERDYFFDAPLSNLSSSFVDSKGETYEWNSTLSPLASVDFELVVPGYRGIQEPSDQVISNLSQIIDLAHQKGIQTRFWDTPNWPIFARERVNTLLLSLGSDWINADDLESLSKF
ncbi:hypothetical protein IE53DRAFT_391302 [Violaceomyces palustris]|uniref:Uncharacterized protein n=1 Tax=Violaceomyces palustris TaxID=1673888 RepID=A0ACD0NL32_9BASI|nr:hypothetical protein IE53DRAFT_391302 [Violaceomyces palustris]